jgi:formylglycine-generating enzyme required for sulfatase activity
LTLGIGLGAGLGAAALLGVGGWPGQGLCLLVIGLALRLGWNAQPVLVGAPVPLVVKKPEPQPEPLPKPAKKPEPDWPPRKPRPVVDIPGLLEMVELPGGTFLMGSPDTDDLAYQDEKPQHPVTVSAFAIARYPVTRKLYREILGRSPEQWEGDKDNDRLPANHVSWFDAVRFCNVLSEKQGLQPCYRIEGNQVNWDRRANGYRLPTEAEWEYAVRAGTTTRWFFGNNSDDLDRYAWFRDNAIKRIHPVMEKEPNPWGLYDMIGNVWEWCWDQYEACSQDNAAIDPVSALTSIFRMLRGGAVWIGTRRLHSARRVRRVPEDRRDDVGFRCVRGPRRQP